MEPTIRAARLQDARSIAEVHVTSWIEAYSGILNAARLTRLSVDERERAWRQALGQKHDTRLQAWIAEFGGSVVGFALTQPCRDEDQDQSTTAELSALYLIRRVWRTGIGRRLMHRALQEIRDQGFRCAILWVLEDNVRAIRFYERAGWIQDKRDPSFKDFGAAALRYRITL
jgi:GNAT superfamily N-acetyltransferase